MCPLIVCVRALMHVCVCACSCVCLCPFECEQNLTHVCFPVSDLCPAVCVFPHSRPLDGCTTGTRRSLVALVVCQCSANWGREEGTIPSVHISQRTRTAAKELSPSAREEFKCRPVTERLKDWAWKTSQRRGEYDVLKQSDANCI